MPTKKPKANYGALFNAGAAIQSGAFPKSDAVIALSEEDYTAVQQLPITVLQDNPYQPRNTMDEEKLKQLAQTIQDQGFQGVLVARAHPMQRGIYQITAGHRRREAAKQAGLETLPVVVKEIADQEMAILSVTENIQREDLTPLDEGRIFCVMMEKMGMTLEQVAAAVKKSESYVRNRRRVAMAPEDIQRMVEQKPDSLRAVFYLLKVTEVTVRASIIEQVLQGHLTADQVDQYVKMVEQRGAGARVQQQMNPETPPLSDLGRTDAFSLVSIETVQKAPDEHLSLQTPGYTPMLSQRQEGVLEVQAEASGELVVFQKRPMTSISKLKTLLNAMKSYAQGVVDERSLTVEEIGLIEQIIEVAQQLRKNTEEK